MWLSFCNGYKNIKKKFFWGKNLSAFFSGFMLMFISLLLNYILCMVAFPGNDFHNLETYVGTEGMPEWFNISLTYPVVVYFFVYTLIFAYHRVTLLYVYFAKHGFTLLSFSVCDKFYGLVSADIE